MFRTRYHNLHMKLRSLHSLRSLRSPFWLWAPLFAWVAVIFVCSSLSAGDIHRLNVFHIPSELVHRIGHFIEYTVLSVLFARAMAHADTGMSPRRTRIVMVVALILFAGTDEWHQTFVPGRHGRASDVLYDILCFSIGIAVYFYYKRRTKEE